MSFIAPEQIIIYFIDIVFLIFLLFALKISYQMITKFNFNSSTNFQYNLEKKNILISTIISFFILIKIPVLFFFLYFLDSLSSSIPGAMCAVGVLNSTPYGAYLIVLKVIVIFVLGYWFYINKFDLNIYGFKYTRIKYKFLIFIAFLMVCEFLLELNLFNNISPEKIVSCCGSVFGGDIKSFSTFLFDIKDSLSVLLTIIIYFLLLLSFIFKRYTIYGIFSILFLIAAVYSLIDFFGTYIYELPTHRCPFCILQKDYNYIGYLLYFLLLSGTFYGSILLFLNKAIDVKTKTKWSKISFLFCTLYLIIVTYYVIKYYISNGVWLK